MGGWRSSQTRVPLAVSSTGRRHSIGSEKAARILVLSPLCPGWGRGTWARWGAEPAL